MLFPFIFSRVTAKAATPSPPPRRKTPTSWTDDEEEEDDYAMRTYNPETLDDELDYAEDDEPESLSILERLALLEKAQTTPPKATAGQSTGASPDVPAKQKKPARKWTRAKEAHLCSLWEEESHLYDCKHKDYRNNARKEKAYNRISAILEIDGNYRSTSKNIYVTVSGKNFLL